MRLGNNRWCNDSISGGLVRPTCGPAVAGGSHLITSSLIISAAACTQPLFSSATTDGGWLNAHKPLFIRHLPLIGKHNRAASIQRRKSAQSTWLQEQCNARLAMPAMSERLAGG